jgi:hypothetical protein
MSICNRLGGRCNEGAGEGERTVQRLLALLRLGRLR